MRTITGVKEVDDLINTMYNSSAPKWKRDAAKHKFRKIEERHDLIVKAIEDSEDYPYDTIWGIIKGNSVQRDD